MSCEGGMLSKKNGVQDIRLYLISTYDKLLDTDRNIEAEYAPRTYANPPKPTYMIQSSQFISLNNSSGV